MERIKSCIDKPAHRETCDALCLRIEGWVHAGSRHARVVAVEMCVEGETAGSTREFFERPDVSAALRVPNEARTGFAILGHFGAEHRPARVTLEFFVLFTDGARERFATCEVDLIAGDYRKNHYGQLLSREEGPALMHRNNIYGSGPSAPGGSMDCLALLRRYLRRPPCRVLDVGCGLGFYGRHLLEAGYAWQGVEVKESDCVELARQGLPHRRVDGRGLPFADDAFDATMCIEVLEHIEDTDAFLRETRRVAPRLLVSVPNVELIPYLQPYAAVPWHLLEGDHKNFFTRWSLRALLGRFYENVEVLGYGEAPLKTVEGLRLDYHLFAVASATSAKQ
jgi:SAM-dependent methyltransferase